MKVCFFACEVYLDGTEVLQTTEESITLTSIPANVFSSKCRRSCIYENIILGNPGLQKGRETGRKLGGLQGGGDGKGRESLGAKKKNEEKNEEGKGNEKEEGKCKMGLTDLHDSHARVFSIFHSLALTSISLSGRHLLYEIRGGSL